MPLAIFHPILPENVSFQTKDAIIQQTNQFGIGKRESVVGQNAEIFEGSLFLIRFFLGIALNPTKKTRIAMFWANLLQKSRLKEGAQD